MQNIIKVFFLIGIPGSGKSTYCKKLKIRRICLDEIRKMLYGDISIQGDPKQVFGMAMRQMRNCIKNEQSFVYDATNADSRSRKNSLDTIRKFADKYNKTVEVNGFVFNTPLDTCLKRNNSRNDRIIPVPEEVIKKMYDKLKKYPPTINEGFDKIEIITAP